MSALRDVLMGPIYIGKGLMTTLKHVVRPATIQYPEQQKPVPPRHAFPGRHLCGGRGGRGLLAPATDAPRSAHTVHTMAIAPRIRRRFMARSSSTAEA